MTADTPPQFDSVEEADAWTARKNALDQVPTCSLCQRERYAGTPLQHPMDMYDYNPLQVVTGAPIGWYSGDDGEVCPECMVKALSRQ